MTHTETARIIALLATDRAAALDLIIDVCDELTVTDADDIYDAALALDPTASDLAADVRDTIRDNTEHDLL